MRVHVRVPTAQVDESFLFHSSFTLCFRKDISLNPELTDYSRLTGQRPTCSWSVSTGITEVHHHIQFLHECLGQNSGPNVCMASTQPLSHLLSLSCLLLNFTLHLLLLCVFPLSFSSVIGSLAFPLSFPLLFNLMFNPSLIFQCSVRPSKTLLFCLISSLRCGYRASVPAHLGWGFSGTASEQVMESAAVIRSTGKSMLNLLERPFLDRSLTPAFHPTTLLSFLKLLLAHFWNKHMP